MDSRQFIQYACFYVTGKDTTFYNLGFFVVDQLLFRKLINVGVKNKLFWGWMYFWPIISNINKILWQMGFFFFSFKLQAWIPTCSNIIPKNFSNRLDLECCCLLFGNKTKFVRKKVLMPTFGRGWEFLSFYFL